MKQMGFWRSVILTAAVSILTSAISYSLGVERTLASIGKTVAVMEKGFSDMQSANAREFSALVNADVATNQRIDRIATSMDVLIQQNTRLISAIEVANAHK